MSMIILFFIIKWNNALNFARAMMNFVLIAQYWSHDNTTLTYFEQSLKKIDIYKIFFRSWRQSMKNSKKHFNIVKLHVMKHFFDIIRRHKMTDDYDTFHDEIRHKYMMKTFFNKINKRKTFQKQLLWHNVRRVKILIMKNIMSYIFENLRKNNARKSIKKKSKSMNVNKIYIIKTIRDFIQLNFFDISARNVQKKCNLISQSNAKNWCYAKDLTKVLNISRMIPTLIVFVLGAFPFWACVALSVRFSRFFGALYLASIFSDHIFAISDFYGPKEWSIFLQFTEYTFNIW